MKKFHTLTTHYIILLTMAIAFCALPTIAATTWYVSTNGADSALGTSWEESFLTISNGLAYAESNDTVIVSNGIYNLRNSSWWTKQLL